MKKNIIFSLIALFLFIPLLSNAKMYIEGGIGVTTSSGNLKSGGVSIETPSATSFFVSPKLGFYITDNFILGFQTDYARGTQITPEDWVSVGSKRVVDSKDVYLLSIFGQYELLNINKLYVYTEATAGYGGFISKTSTGANTVTDDPGSIISVSINPSLAYAITSNLALKANLDFLSIGFASIKITDIDNPSLKTITHAFTSQVNGSVIGNTFGITSSAPITLGISYKF